ncbi:hypothetical protein FHW12_000291 [Dokdonella fugitiva]|uniref:Uncharacterized protein n=1 Tax=Dokdonella fugitiva TaxID=328517 RepID=A0A839EYW3_9GAMM|nr:hypothetical protein [Dokdonella fugitiva]MBA8886100.1 hypothetical protein [Dokdonella fugitiva]
MKDIDDNSGYAALWLWFGLSRAGWLTMPRVLLHEMPDDWQRRMAELLNEWSDAWPNQPDVVPHVSFKCAGKFVKGPGWISNYRYPDRAAINELRIADR